MHNYLDRLTATKARFPFVIWQDSGLDQYTPEACAAFAAVFEQLIEKLAALGEDAPEVQKIALFQVAVEALNSLNDEDDSLIETGEREDLCALCNVVLRAAGIDPSKYGDGEGPATEWRDW